MGFKIVVSSRETRDEKFKDQTFRKQGARFVADNGDSFSFEVSLFEGVEPYAPGDYEIDPMSFDRQGGRLAIPRLRFVPIASPRKA